MGNTLLTALGGIATAFASALCCAGPILAVMAGVSGAGLAATFEPLRPYLLGSTAAFLGFGFHTVHREEKKACEPGKPCADPKVRRRMKFMLWTATVVAVVFATFPRWQTLIF
ncbi:MAG: mercury transporter MerT [Gemmatimonadetes bacterium]|nr:mercury transporter MerT [Gemmatimonadota bacterium]